MASQDVEIGTLKGLNKEHRHNHSHGRTAHAPSSPRVQFLTNIHEVILGTKLSVLFPAIPLAIVAHTYNIGRPWVFGLSMLGLTPLAERISFLTEQSTYVTCPTVGGHLIATCGNVRELINAFTRVILVIFALYQSKADMVKYSILGSIISNLLLVLGSSLLCGGIANMSQEQKYDRKQANINFQLLLLALLCHILPLMFRSFATSETITSIPTLQLSRASSIIMLITYLAYLWFQLKTHSQFSETQEDDEVSDDAVSEEEETVIGFWSAMVWLIGMTAIVALLSEYVVGTIEDATNSWGLSVSFISIILLPIVGNAAEHAGAVIFAYKNKLDISLGVALGSATQIAMFVGPLTVIVAWILGIKIDLDFNLLETGLLGLSILVTAFTLQDGTSHYMKGLVLLLCYVGISACFFVLETPIVLDTNILNVVSQTSLGGALVVQDADTSLQGYMFPGHPRQI